MTITMTRPSVRDRATFALATRAARAYAAAARLSHLGPAELVERACEVADRPLFLAARAVECSAWYYAAEAVNVADETVHGVRRWYDDDAPEAIWRRPVSDALGELEVHTATAWLRTNDRWRAATDRWKARPEPMRLSTVRAMWAEIDTPDGMPTWKASVA